MTPLLIIVVPLGKGTVPICTTAIQIASSFALRSQSIKRTLTILSSNQSHATVTGGWTRENIVARTLVHQLLQNFFHKVKLIKKPRIFRDACSAIEALRLALAGFGTQVSCKVGGTQAVLFLDGIIVRVIGNTPPSMTAGKVACFFTELTKETPWAAASWLVTPDLTSTFVLALKIAGYFTKLSKGIGRAPTVFSRIQVKTVCQITSRTITTTSSTTITSRPILITVFAIKRDSIKDFIKKLHFIQPPVLFL
mmetsp:Transcript_8460/g.20360  ORF Transcript_8460/g.20360 Transcript_8460/m.20360 type:complete len:252 (-) Transcript_8460:937-1692(-)